MNYVDQLVLTGTIDDVGNPIADNIGNSYRLGLEIDAVVRFLKNLFGNQILRLVPTRILTSIMNLMVN